MRRLTRERNEKKSYDEERLDNLRHAIIGGSAGFSNRGYSLIVIAYKPCSILMQ